jgi:hypothetical protein
VIPLTQSVRAALANQLKPGDVVLVKVLAREEADR